MKHSTKALLPLFTLLLIPFVMQAHEVSTTDQQTLSGGGLLSYVYVGAKHMLTGYDHLLFLAGVVFYLKGFRDIVRFITVFTIGHSVTLIGATYLGIRADEHLIDAVIAFSVIYKGFENLGGFSKLLKIESPNLLLMVALFGLIHGFGLSTSLQSFQLGAEQLLLKVVCFNVGVELGQVLALIPILLIITRWKGRRGYPTFYTLVNWGLVAAGIALLVYQIYGYYHPNWHMHGLFS